jgi:hypothetical protein
MIIVNSLFLLPESDLRKNLDQLQIKKLLTVSRSGLLYDITSR